MRNSSELETAEGDVFPAGSGNSAGAGGEGPQPAAVCCCCSSVIIVAVFRPRV